MPKLKIRGSGLVFTPEQLAERWKIDVGTLRNWRAMRPRKGPRYFRLGKGPSAHVRYHVKAVELFERKNSVAAGRG